MKSSIDLYIEEIYKIPLLTMEEEIDLGHRIKNGDQSAIDKMVEHNLRLVLPIAKLYIKRGIEFNDLIQYGNLGLITAARKYDVDKGTKFSTYAVPWIRQKIVRSLENYGRNIRLPNDVYQSVQKYNAQKQSLEKIKGHKLTQAELQKEMNISLDKIKEFERLSRDTLSLNMNIETNKSKGDNYLEDIISDDYLLEDNIIGMIRDTEILKLISDIIDNPRNLAIILDKYNLQCSNEILAKKYNMSRAGISLIIRNAIKKIRSSKEILKFIDYTQDEKEVIENLKTHNSYIKIKK